MARRALLLVLVVAALCARAAASSDAPYYYITPAPPDLTVLLPPPPDLGTAAERADQAAVASAVAARTPSQDAAARESVRSVFFFARSVGDGFNAANFPTTAGFFERIGSDVGKLIDAAKLHWGRARPSGAAKARGSYPSGHAAFAAATAIVLAQLLPCKRAAIFAQARGFAENRIILGLHYPSDIAAGWTAGTLAAYVMMGNASFQTDFSAAKRELHAICPS
ncbi:MAG TPA: phosphatase PAP2 family protein [Candidatus Cybelea sp.]|jgi:acid phosphatase (class A)|nr:phosphatase PAP2 family protein [Candidatus Cybelea sp.]